MALILEQYGEYFVARPDGRESFFDPDAREFLALRRTIRATEPG